MTAGYSAYSIAIKGGIKQMHGLQSRFSSILRNMGKTKADFELSLCSVKTYCFKVRVSQSKRGQSPLFLKLCFLKHTPKY